MALSPVRAALALLLLIGPALAAWSQPGTAGSVLTLAGQCTMQSGNTRVALKPGDGVHVGVGA